jgi:hypothetical protein
MMAGGMTGSLLSGSPSCSAARTNCLLPGNNYKATDQFVQTRASTDGMCCVQCLTHKNTVLAPRLCSSGDPTHNSQSSQAANRHGMDSGCPCACQKSHMHFINHSLATPATPHRSEEREEGNDDSLV